MSRKEGLNSVERPFFEVEKNPDKPFVVQGGGAAIRVLGTAFNVKAFAQTPQTAVYVLSGKVSLSVLEEQEREMVLSPGETGVLDKTDLSLSLEKEDPSNVLAWKDKKLVFKKTELQQVFKTLEDYFEVNIKVSNPAILSCRFTSSFQDPELEEVLEVLRISLNLSISRQGESLKIEGDGCK
jgi:transmembrane sensor